MVPDGSVKIGCGGVGYDIKRELGEFFDCVGFRNSQQLGDKSSLKRQETVPSLGSATASDTFFSSLIESSSVASRGVILPSTNAAVCSNAVQVSIHNH